MNSAATRRRLANAVRALAMDAVQAAKSGHPGMPMGMADIAEVLWNGFLRHNPADPGFVDRDRFVLSNGHGSMLLYALLHLSGYDLSLEQLRNFRQLHSQTPGHPEFGDTPGVETTTGPLGQGLANAVGMALGEKILAARFNLGGHRIVDHHTYVFVGDGCLMEGISHEACSLAGHIRLGKLIAFYDDNNISIDGEVRHWFSDDTTARFHAYGWHVVDAVDGHDTGAVADAIKQARAEEDAPSLIVCKTVIGFGAPNKAGTESSHGAPLGAEEVALARENLNWNEAPFVIPDEVYRGWDARERGARLQEEWRAKFARFRAEFPGDAAEFERRAKSGLPAGWGIAAEKFLARTVKRGETVASRQASQNTLEAYAPHLPELLGGSADLTGSNLTKWSGSRPLSAQGGEGEGEGDGGANYIYYGVREFAMCAVMNGIALHGGFIPYGGTFLMFSEYARNALRMAALMGVRAVFVFTHDSIGLGEDGPTHQAVEQAATLRLMPNMSLWRPCDAVETAVAWRAAIERKNGPTSLLLSRQNLAHQQRDDAQVANIARGGYVLRDCDGAPEVILIATGSEVSLAVEAAAGFTKKGRKVRVVSMPSADVFEAQDSNYRDAVLPPLVRNRIAVEAGVTDIWRKYVGLDGAVLGLDSFGASAPAADVFRHFGFTVDNLSAMVEAMLK